MIEEGARQGVTGAGARATGRSITAAPTSSRSVGHRGFARALWIGAVALILFLLLPIVALVVRAAQETDAISAETSQTLRQALRLTFVTSLITLAIVVAFGTPLAYLLARQRFRGRRLVETLIDLPMVLPPAVAGIALLMAFGRRGIVGEPLDRIGITFGFTTAAVVMAQIFVAVPFYVRAARAGFARVSHDLEEAAADLGASPARVFGTVTLPLAAQSIAAGAVLSWARAVGEFGATIMFAGNFAGRTQTMSLAIYGRYDAGDLDSAIVLAAVLLGVSMLFLLAVRSVGGRAGDLSG
ncbi:MAG: ABC transporter permease [Thermomicrobiales bacterium]